MEYVNKTIGTQKVLIHDNDTEFILLELQVEQHVATHLTEVVVVSGIEEAQVLFPTKTINDTTAEVQKVIPSRRSDEEADE